MGILRDVIRDVIKPVLVDTADRWWTNPWYSQSPIKLIIPFTDTQFKFSFRLPTTSTIIIDEGDGTRTSIVGKGAVTVIHHDTTYTAPGTYYFYVEGDCLDLTRVWARPIGLATGDLTHFYELVELTQITFTSSNFTGDVTRWSVLTKVTICNISNTLMIGSIDGWGTVLVSGTFSNTKLSGNISSFANKPLLQWLYIDGTNITGDASTLKGLSALEYFTSNGTTITFNSSDAWAAPLIVFDMSNSNLISSHVDNALIALANGGVASAAITLGGNNAVRTSASDAAKTTLESAGCTVIVNE